MLFFYSSPFYLLALQYMFFLFLFLLWFSSKKKNPFGLFFQSNGLNVVVGAFSKIRLDIHRILAGNWASQPLQSSLFKAKVAARLLGASSSSKKIKGSFHLYWRWDNNNMILIWGGLGKKIRVPDGTNPNPNPNPNPHHLPHHLHPSI